MSDKEDILICIDTEFESPNIITGNCLQLAFVAFKSNATPEESDDDWVVDGLSLCFKDQGKEKDVDTMNFWSNHSKIHDDIISKGEDIKISMIKLQEWMYDLSQNYNLKGFVCDHSSVDFQWFRCLYTTHLDNTKPKIFLTWRCNCTWNMTETIVKFGYTRDEIKEYYKNENLTHNHFALDDAKNTAYQYLRLKMFIDNNK